jgi:Chaperone of endosialidase
MTAVGANALSSDTTGSSNTAVGGNALSSNTVGSNNTAIGSNALSVSSRGDADVAVGASALGNNTTGSFNTAIGTAALFRNTTGYENTAIGHSALSGTTGSSSGNENTAVGYSALGNNAGGSLNTAVGWSALTSNSTGHNNAALGLNALLNNTSGSNNIALGYQAGLNLTSGSNNIEIGNTGKSGESGKIRIGTQGTQNGAFIAGIFAKTVSSSTPVFINGNGQLGTAQSSARYKDQIQPMDKGSEAILKLNPVTFRYKEELDPDRIPQFGLIAEEVEKVNPNLVVRDEEGKAMTVRYEAVNAMLLNEFLKEHRKVEELEKQINALTAAVQKVNDCQQPGKAAPQIIANN